MADIRCSNCQTINPTGATVCKNCGQPLADESISWLDSLRSGTQSSSLEEPETSAKAADEAQPEEVPDWLQRIRQRNQESQAEADKSNPAEEPSEELPDWLQDIQQPSSKQSAEPKADWLQGLRGSEPAAEEDAPSTSETPISGDMPFADLPAEESQSDTPDWLKNLGTWKEEGNQEPSRSEEAQPADSFGPFGKDQTPAQTPSPFAENDQDWLNQFSQPNSDQQAAAESSGTDWMAGLQAASESTEEPGAEAQPASTDSNMDWMASLQAASEPPAEQPTAEEQPAAGEEFDWMSRVGGEAQPGEPISGAFPSAELPAGEGFSWENELAASGAAAGEPSETPDWLRQFPIDQTDAAKAAENEGQFGSLSSGEGETESAQPAGDLQGWLSNFSSQQSDQPAAETQPPTESSDEQQAFQTEDIPDWLKQVPPEERPAQPAEPVTPISEESQASFSWESLGIRSEPGTTEPEKPADALPFAGANLPEWLDQTGEGKPRLPNDEELIPPAKPAGESESPTPFGGNEIPDWLGESDKIEAAAQATGETPPEGADQSLEAAELPSWLQAMRPIETVAPKSISTEDKQVEKAGPLAGLSGVLPTEDLVGQYIKPPLYSIKLRVSEKQRVHASLIENLIGEETQPQPVPAERGEAPKRVLRFLVAVVLVLAILLPMLNFLPAFPSTNILPQELVSFGQIIGDETILPKGSAVLLALEYEPGLSGEMQTASEAVIRQLAERDVRLTIISTSPTGPILAESLLDKAGFDPALVVNLGYLAGGSTGLQSFSLSPVRSAPSTLEGQLAPWDSGVLAGVTRLSDFAATIVLTDDPDKGRTWVEQIQPALNGKPMLMVSSAQASPLLLPYYNSGQVKGIISGISGAASYESLVQSNGTATLLYGSYQYGMLLAALLILVGGLITGIISSITRGKAKKEA